MKTKLVCLLLLPVLACSAGKGDKEVEGKAG